MKSFILSLIFVFCVSGCGRKPETLNRKGVEALNAGEYSKAARLLEKAAEKTEGADAAEIWGHAGLAAAHLTDRQADAEVFLRKALVLDEENSAANYNLGNLLLQQDLVGEALEFLEKAAATGTAEAWEVLAGIALHQGNYAEAFDYLQQARVRGETARVLTALAGAGKGQLSVEESRQLLLQATTMDGDYAPAHLNLAALLDQHRLDPGQAAFHYETFLRLMPEDEKVPLIQQRLLIMKDRQARGDFSRPDPVRREVESLLDQATAAAEADDKLAALQNCLRANAVATREQRTDLRERALRAAATLAPDSARAHFGLGQFLLSQNRKTEAMVSMEKAREIGPGLQMTLRPTILLAADLGRKAAATAMLQRAEQAGAANPDLLLDVGDLYAEALNNERESKRVYKAILDGFPDYSERAAVQARLDR